MNGNNQVITIDPTPEQIRERCKLIRENWSAGIRKRRRGEYIPAPWVVPLISLAELPQLAMDPEDK